MKQILKADAYEKDGITRYAATPTEKTTLEFSGWKKVERAVRAAADAKKIEKEEEVTK